MFVALGLACQPVSDAPVIRTTATDPTTIPVTPTPPVPTPQEVPVASAAVTVTPAVLAVRVLAYFTGERAPTLHRLADRRVFVSDGPKIAEVPARMPAATADVRAHKDDLEWRELPRVTPRSNDTVFSGEHLETFGGRWPDLTLATVAFMGPRTATGRGVFRRAGSGWRQLKNGPGPGGSYAAIAPWTDGRVLALRSEDLYSGAGEDFVPGLDVFGAKTPAPTLPADFKPYDMATTPEGDVFVVGARGAAPTLWVLHWGPAGGEPVRTDRLPEFRDVPAHESQWFITPGVSASSSAPSRARPRRLVVGAAGAATPASPAGWIAGAFIVVSSAPAGASADQLQV